MRSALILSGIVGLFGFGLMGCAHQEAERARYHEARAHEAAEQGNYREAAHEEHKAQKDYQRADDAPLP